MPEQKPFLDHLWVTKADRNVQIVSNVLYWLTASRAVVIRSCWESLCSIFELELNLRCMTPIGNTPPPYDSLPFSSLDSPRAFRILSISTPKVGSSSVFF